MVRLLPGSSARRLLGTHLTAAAHSVGRSTSRLQRRPLHGTPPTSRDAQTPSIRISLEGNIAAGKSTFLEILRKEFDVQTVAEPVARWQEIAREDGGSDNLLDLFYSDPKRWAYTFQTFAFLSRMQAQMTPVEGRAGQVVLYERSVLSDKHIFATNCARSGLFNSVEWALYRDWHAWLLASFDTRLDGIVYLRARFLYLRARPQMPPASWEIKSMRFPETCMQRLKTRGRGEEASVPLSYLEELHERHEDWLVRGAAGAGGGAAAADGAPMVLVLDAEQDILASPGGYLRRSMSCSVAELAELAELAGRETALSRLAPSRCAEAEHVAPSNVLTRCVGLR